MFQGIIYFISGMFMLVIPAVGWILGSLFMIAGAIKFIVKLVSLFVLSKNERDIYCINETASASVPEQLQQLTEVHEKGHMSEAEFTKSKAKLPKQL